MDTNSHVPHGAVNTDVGYDHSDLSVRGIIIFLVGIGLAGIFTHLIIWGIFVGAKKFTPWSTDSNPMQTMETAPEAPPLTNAGPQSVVKFPEPRLQTDDTADMSKFKAEEDERLYTSTPYRAPDGSIHINIRDAMALIAQRGLPTRQAGQGSQAQSAPQGEAKPATKPAQGTPGMQ